MKYSDYKFSLDLHSVDTPAALAVKQGDTNRRICITLREHGMRYSVDGCTASMTAKLPDGSIVVSDCEVADGVILCPLAATITADCGEVEADITLADGSQKLTTPKFCIIVDEVVYDA